MFDIGAQEDHRTYLHKRGGLVEHIIGTRGAESQAGCVDQVNLRQNTSAGNPPASERNCSHRSTQACNIVVHKPRPMLKSTALFLAAVLIFILPTRAASPLIISEFMAANDNSISDNDG